MSGPQSQQGTRSPMVVTKPGVYVLSEDIYHGDPVPDGSLSSTGAKQLLPPSCPAVFQYRRAHPQHKRVFDFGHAAHQQVLGVGAELVVVDADSWRTKAAQQQQTDAYAEGKVPLLPVEYEQVQAMAAVLRADPLAGPLLDPSAGVAERSIFWRDPEFGVWRRARPDFLRGGPRLLVVDYKTTPAASPGEIEKALHNFGYHQQAAWYLDAVAAVGLAESAAFLFVFQEKTPPYLVTVVEPDAEALLWGRRLNAKALDIYRRCTETDHWPGYSSEVLAASLPGWATKGYELAYELGDYDIKERTA